ncbi:hypothetical protein ACLKA6_014758, partial [Drosophila palustris]
YGERGFRRDCATADGNCATSKYYWLVGFLPGLFTRLTGSIPRLKLLTIEVSPDDEAEDSGPTAEIKKANAEIDCCSPKPICLTSNIMKYWEEKKFMYPALYQLPNVQHESPQQRPGSKEAAHSPPIPPAEAGQEGPLAGHHPPGYELAASPLTNGSVETGLTPPPTAAATWRSRGRRSRSRLYLRAATYAHHRHR